MFCRRCYRNRGYYKNSSQNEINFEQLKNMVSKGAILIDFTLFFLKYQPFFNIFSNIF